MGCNDNGGRIIPSPCGCNSEHGSFHRHDMSDLTGSCGCNGINIKQSNCSCGGRGCSTCRCGNCSPAQGAPFYAQAGGCQENHDAVFINERYSAAIKLSASFNIPVQNGSAVVVSPGLENIVIDSYLWNPSYGYYKVIAFDYVTSTITIQNLGTTGNSAPGTVVPACTYFIVTDSPDSSISGGASIFPYLSADFTAPACGVPLTISVTNTNGLVAGKNIQILGATYQVISINSATLIVIENISPGCFGLPQGSIVKATDANGNYIVPLALIDTDQCSNASVLQGSLIVCANGVAQPLKGTGLGQIPVLVDVNHSLVQMQTVAIDTLYCSPLTADLGLIAGTGTYTFSVVSNVSFTLSDTLIMNDGAIGSSVFTITNIDGGGHNITATVIPVPGVNHTVLTGTAVCQQSCCSKLQGQINTTNANFANFLTSHNTGITRWEAPAYTPEVLTAAGATPLGIYPDGLNAGSWAEIQIDNTTNRSCDVILSGVVSIDVKISALIGLPPGPPVPPLAEYRISLSMDTNSENFTIGGAGTRPWISNLPNSYYENFSMNAYWGRSPLVIEAGLISVDEVTLTIPFELKWFDIHGGYMPAGFTARWAVRPNLVILERGDSIITCTINNKYANMHIGIYPK